MLRDVSFLDKYQSDPDVLYARALVDPGSKVWGGNTLRHWIQQRWHAAGGSAQGGRAALG